MKKYMQKCEAVLSGGPVQDVCSWYGEGHCREYNRGRNKNKCQKRVLKKYLRRV